MASYFTVWPLKVPACCVFATTGARAAAGGEVCARPATGAASSKLATLNNKTGLRIAIPP
ncbi:MAG: hypothetical protein Q7T84_12675 [Phenylobacterium sp.]|uniref:hypothetical protein n=1 Tax=Phenylobacterium sp. TaxID=1871053 RepID=UPI00272675F9|nr:hypothetical protein [Phenylobacterium sp.]MDO9432145.1 hypothetical protein [Phenylobacterium sp.]